MMRQVRPLRRVRALFPGDSPRSDEPGTWRRSALGIVKTGNFFRTRDEKTRGDGDVAATEHPPDRAHARLPGRLNLFQATMLEWRDTHPYNALHAVHVERPLDSPALAAAIDAELSQSGLTGLLIDRAHGRYAWRGGPARAQVETIDAGADWHASLAQAFERHLNMPFARDGALDPFRFFAMPLDGGFFLGIAYDHFIAGGDSIVVLLNAIARRYAGERQAGAALQRYPRTHRRLFARHPLRLVLGLRRLPALAASCRRTVRIHYRSIDDGHNGFMLFHLDAAQYKTLRDAARGWGVTLNDALMALLLLAQDATFPPRDTAKRRHELAVASIINLRDAHGEDVHTTFGQFLSSFRVSHPVPHGITLYELAGDVHAATARIKREKLFLVTLFAMAVDRVIGRFQSRQQRMAIYAKNYPVGAGVSSLNVGALWEDGGSVPTYIRGVPTGPLSPIVLAVTTCGDALWGGLSYRTSALTSGDVARIRDDMLARIRALS